MKMTHRKSTATPASAAFWRAIADVEVTELGQFDGQVAGARRHFKHMRAGGEPSGDELGRFLVVASALGVSSIPPCDEAFHRQALVRFLRVLSNFSSEVEKRWEPGIAGMRHEFFRLRLCVGEVTSGIWARV